MNVSAIAAFIAARLQYPLPRCNSVNPRVSTIRVEQHKEKFGNVRVYCTLAHAEEVHLAYLENNNLGVDDEVTVPKEFKDLCWKRDASVYRRSYLDMVDLLPHAADLILSAADHRELLCRDVVEMDAMLGCSARDVKFYLEKYDVKTYTELQHKLCRACGFHVKEEKR